MGIQINGATDSITAIDGTIDVVSAIGNAGVVTATAFVGNITGNVTGNINHASNLELQVGGVTRASINSSGQFTSTGNVGIKKSVPGAPLHVLSTDTGGGNIAYFDDTGSGVTGRLMVLTTDGVASGGIKFQTVNKRYTYFGNATNKLIIDNNNSRIGINTDVPSKPLHVDGTIFASGATTSLDGGIRIQPNNDGTNYGGVIYGGAHNDNNTAIYMRRGADGGNNTIDINSYGMFRVFTNGALASQDERLRIDSSGRLLLNTTTTYVSNQMMIVKGASPSAGGNRPYDGQLAIEGSETTGAINTGGVLAFIGHSGSGSRGFGSIRCLKEDGTSGNYGSYMSFETRANGSAPAEKLRIKSTGAINLTSENTTGWQLDAGDNSASYTAIDNHFPTTNRTLYINNETTHRSIAFWNKNGSDGYGFGLDNSGNFKVVYGSTERLRITSGGQVHIGSNGSVYGKLSVSIPAQSGGAALQVHNTAAGSGDGSLTNIVLRSVNAAGTQWSMAEYRAQYHKFANQGTEVLRTQVSGDYGSVETRNAKSGYGGYGIVVGGVNHVWMGDQSGAGLYNDTDNGWYIYGAKGGDTYLYSNGSPTFRSYVTGDYGCVQTVGSKNGWGGLSVNGQYNFMADGGSACGIYNDIDNEWMAYFARNDAFILYHNGEGVLTSDTNGPIVTSHNHFKLNSGNWTGEHAGKMQFHSGYMYNQSQNGWIFRDDGTNGNYDVYTINQTGGVTTSDERLKENIKTIPDALNKVSQLKGRSFDFKSSGIKSQGVIAQEVEPILPDIVSTTPVINGEESFKKVNYGALSGVFIEAIKELKAKIETLEQENIILKARVSTLEGS